MINAVGAKNRSLRIRLARLSSCNVDFWSFRGAARRDHGHGFFQYPAMMVPQMAGAILDTILQVHPEISTVADPFAGSGTVLTETMFRGRNFLGYDINPLAILLCKTKCGPFFPEDLDNIATDLLARINSDKSCGIDISFPNIDKWFRKDVQIELSKIRRAIEKQPCLWSRRFFWIALAEAVRLSGNSRTTTFKLHIQPANEINSKRISPIALFERAIKRNLSKLASQTNYLSSKNLLEKGHYKSKIEIQLGDCRHISQKEVGPVDLIMTSPPYGDNVTTVPYGQYSYLPLQWLDLSDIDADSPQDYLRTTMEIDYRSLGGSKKVFPDTISYLKSLSPSLERFLRDLKEQPKDRTNRVVAFIRDLDATLPAILNSLRPGGLLVWTLGNRKVGGVRVPLDKILTEILLIHNVYLITSISRKIPSKRMANKNSIAETISTESILVMRKGSGNDS